MCRLSDRWRSITCLSDLALVLKTEEPVFIFFTVKNDQNCPNKTIACSGGRFYNFKQGLKVASSI